MRTKIIDNGFCFVLEAAVRSQHVVPYATVILFLPAVSHAYIFYGSFSLLGFYFFYWLNYFIVAAVLAITYSFFLRRAYSACASSPIPVNTPEFFRAVKSVFARKYRVYYIIAVFVISLLLRSSIWYACTSESYDLLIICTFFLYGLCVFIQIENFGLIAFIVEQKKVGASIFYTLCYIAISNFVILFVCLHIFVSDIGGALGRFYFLLVEMGMFWIIFKRLGRQHVAQKNE